MEKKRRDLKGDEEIISMDHVRDYIYRPSQLDDWSLYDFLTHTDVSRRTFTGKRRRKTTSDMVQDDVDSDAEPAVLLTRASGVTLEA